MSYMMPLREEGNTHSSDRARFRSKVDEEKKTSNATILELSDDPQSTNSTWVSTKESPNMSFNAKYSLPLKSYSCREAVTTSVKDQPELDYLSESSLEDDKEEEGLCPACEALATIESMRNEKHKFSADLVSMSDRILGLLKCMSSAENLINFFEEKHPFASVSIENHISREKSIFDVQEISDEAKLLREQAAESSFTTPPAIRSPLIPSQTTTTASGSVMMGSKSNIVLSTLAKLLASPFEGADCGSTKDSRKDVNSVIDNDSSPENLSPEERQSFNSPPFVSPPRNSRVATGSGLKELIFGRQSNMKDQVFSLIDRTTERTPESNDPLFVPSVEKNIMQQKKQSTLR